MSRGHSSAGNRAPYSREDLGTLPGSLAFASDLAGLKDYLERASSYSHYGEDRALAEAFLVLLGELERGTEPLEAIIVTLSAWHQAQDAAARADRDQRERDRAEYGQRAAEEEISRKAECPYCGASPGAVCRTVSERRLMRSWSHRARFRLARSLNDGTRAPAG